MHALFARTDAYPRQLRRRTLVESSAFLAATHQFFLERDMVWAVDYASMRFARTEYASRADDDPQLPAWGCAWGDDIITPESASVPLLSRTQPAPPSTPLRSGGTTPLIDNRRTVERFGCWIEVVWRYGAKTMTLASRIMPGWTSQK